jgi:hypothetical protein
MKSIIWSLAAGIVLSINSTPSCAAEIQDRIALGNKVSGKASSLPRKRDRHTANRPGRNLYVETDAPIIPMACESVAFPRHPRCPEPGFDFNVMRWIWW